MDLTSIFDLGGKILDRVLPDPKAKAEAQLELLKLQQTGELAQLTAETDLMKGQLEINVEEAKSANLFVAGWRPFIGWVCGGACAWTWVGAPIVHFFYPDVAMPALSADSIYPILMGMLGLGTMRTVEKLNGAATSVNGKVLKST